MRGRAAATMIAALTALVAACGGNGDQDRASKLPASDVKGRAARFAQCAKKSEYEVVLPKPPNERTDFLLLKDAVVAYTDAPDTPKRKQVEEVVVGCLRG
jgi:hypothetical protein